MDQNQLHQVGEKIKTARKERGWSQARLATEAGVSENTVLSVEQAQRTPQDAKLRAILDALELAAPADGALDLEGVPEDIRIFLRVAAQRLKVLPEARRAVVLAHLYPVLLLED